MHVISFYCIFIVVFPDRIRYIHNKSFKVLTQSPVLELKLHPPAEYDGNCLEVKSSLTILPLSTILNYPPIIYSIYVTHVAMRMITYCSQEESIVVCSKKGCPTQLDVCIYSELFKVFKVHNPCRPICYGI